MRCEACGFGLAASAKFCSECGEPVARPEGPATSRVLGAESSPSPLDGERRQLTVLFSDLVGSTAMATRLDPEDWRDVVSAYQVACASAVERFGGYVAQYLGDGLVVYFGYPTAHEDDPLRATRAGLGIIEALAELEPRLARHAVRLVARVGVHTGRVVVGEVGSSGRRETLAHGDTTNLAARLQEVALPGTVVLSAATFRLVRGHFVTEELGVHALKGIAKPVAVYRAVRAVRVRSTLGLGQDTAVTPLVGRRQELRLLLDRWELVNERRGQAVLLSGEAGIGKSRVALALRHGLATHPHTWLECRGVAHLRDTALHPLVSLQEDALGLASFDTPEQKTAQLERSLDQLGMSPAENLPLFTDLHALPLPARYHSLGLSPEAQRRRTLESLVEWFLRLSEEQPLVVLVEDLHSVDPTTIEVLERLVERAAERRILVLLTHRPVFSPPWTAGPSVTPVVLSRLTRSDSAELLGQIEAARGRLPEDIAREIVNRSDGVPLFVEELAKAVLEAEAARPAGSDATERPSVPSSLQDSLMARLDQLGPAKDLAQLCATLGREFSLELVRATAPLEGEALALALDRLVSTELLQRRGDPPVYSFRHTLVQEQAYESLLKTTRQASHRKIAEVMASRFPQTVSAQPEVLAHHYDEGGLAEAALGFWLQAGQRSLGRSANVEASRQLRRGLDAIARLPGSPSRDQQELLLLTMRGVALIAARGYGADEVEHAFARARVLCQKLGDTPHLFPVLFGLSLFYLVRSRPQPAHELTAQLEAIAEATGDEDCALEVHSAKAAICFWEGKLLESQEHLLRARTIFDPDRHGHHVFVYGQDPQAYGYIYGALTLWFLGYPEQAVLSAERALQLAERTRHPLTLVGVLSFSADLHHHLKNSAAFGDFAERTIEVAMDQNLPMWAASAHSMRGWARFQGGDQEAGIAEIQAGLDAFRKTGAEINTAYLTSRLVEACLISGRIEEGLAGVDEAFRGVDGGLEHYYEAELHRLKGELLRRLPDPPIAQAEACFERAVTISRAQSAKSLELRAAMSLGNLWVDAGRRSEAASLLAGVYDWFTEGRSTPDLVAAEHLLTRWRE
jgi:class 3 adenylate cyclase/predicted ATPase